jgi:hypothetical protein
MILYHGSYTHIEKPDLTKCLPYKDFGKGFYLTDIKKQAERMAEKVAKMRKGTPCLNIFDFDFETALKSALKIKTFNEPNEEWAEFVMKNRDMNIAQPYHNYDIVIGPVADDNIARILRMYTENFLSKEQLLRELTFAKVTSQYFFHTDEALKLLTRL